MTTGVSERLLSKMEEVGSDEADTARRAEGARGVEAGDDRTSPSGKN